MKSDKNCTVKVQQSRDGFDWDIVDTCYYKRNNDTLFFSSNPKQQCKIEYNPYESTVGKGFPVLMKLYQNDILLIFIFILVFV